MEVQPRSPGRIFLARGFEHFCTLHHGLSDVEIERGFAVGDEASTVSYLRMATGLLGDLLATGAIRSFARAFGGGPAIELPSSVWEIDDPWGRFAACSIDPGRPFDPEAKATHWIFVDLEDWNDVLQASVADERPGIAVEPHSRSVETTVAARAVPVDRPGLARPDTGDRLLRLPEVEHRTGLSKSTIYRRMSTGRFPTVVPVLGGMALWRETEVAAWIADPR